MIQRSEKGYVTGCDCATYAARCKAYRMPRPCDHMLAAMREKDSEVARLTPQRDPNRVRTDVAPFYAATYEATLSGVRYVGDVDVIGRVRLTSVERSGFAADYPLDALTDADLDAAKKALASQAKALAERGEVDIFSLPSADTWREASITSLVHAMDPRDRRAQAELQALRDSEAARAVAIAARCAGSEAA